MRELVRVSTRVCARCQYHCYVKQRPACNYLGLTEKSRIYENGKQLYDPEFCDKFVEGPQVEPKRWCAPTIKREEIDHYVAEVITNEKSTRNYFHKQLMGRSRRFDV